MQAYPQVTGEYGFCDFRRNSSEIDSKIKTSRKVPSLNPAGRPLGSGPSSKGLARQIRERTNNLEEQISESIRISLDRDHKHQFHAIQWLAERAYGRVPEISAFAELDQQEAVAAIQALSSAQLEALASVVSQARAQGSQAAVKPEQQAA